MIRALILVALLVGCGSAPNPCTAVAELEAADARFTEGDIATALADRNVADLRVALDDLSADLTELRDEVADPDLKDVATSFVRGANLMSVSLAGEQVSQGDLDASFEEFDTARAGLDRFSRENDC